MPPSFFSSVIVLRAASRASFAMRVAADDPLGRRRIDVRIFEQPELELVRQHRRHQLVELRFGERPFAHQLHQVLVAIRLGQLDVHARPHREQRPPPCRRWPHDGRTAPAARPAREWRSSRTRRTRRSPTRRAARRAAASGWRATARRRSRCTRPSRSSRRRARSPPGTCDRNVSRSTRSETLTGAQLLPDSGWPWAAKCLSVAITCFLSRNVRVALKALHRRNAQLRDEVRILAVRFLDAAPTRIAGHVDHRRERLVRAARARFRGRHREQPLDQVGIKRRAQADRLRKARGIDRRLAVQTLFVKNDRECRAGSPRRRTSGWRWSARPFRRAFLPPPASLGRPTCPRPLPCPKFARAFARSKLPCSSSSSVAFCCQTHSHLRGLLFERHPREQVGHALVDRQCDLDRRTVTGYQSIRRRKDSML